MRTWLLRTLPMHVRSRIIGSALALSVPGGVMAQGTSLGAVVSTSNHRLLGDPLFGAALQARFPRRESRVTFRIGAEWVTGDAERVGSACAGLVQPGTCGPEPVRDNARLVSANAGSAIRVLGGGRFALSVTGEVRIASVRAHTRGLSSGNTLTASKMLWGALAGLETAWVPMMHVPIAVELGAAVGTFVPQARSMIADGYTPFEHDFSLDMLRLAIVWRATPD